MGAPGRNGVPPSPVALVDVGEKSTIARRDAKTLDRLLAELRIVAFRRWLATSVTQMSVLVPDLVSTEGRDLDCAVNALRPTRAWGFGASTVGTAKIRYLARVGAFYRYATCGGSGVRRDQRSVGPAFCQGRVVLRAGTSPLERVVVEVVAGGLEVLIGADGFALRTIAGQGRLRLDRGLPDALAAACRGRSLDEIVDHALLRGRGFEVDDVVQHGSASTIVFRVGDLPVAMPW